MSEHVKNVLIGISLIIFGIGLILYVGFIILLAGGIITVKEQLNSSANSISPYVLGWGFIKICLFPVLVYTVSVTLINAGLRILIREDI